MTVRIRDIDGGRELKFDAQSLPGSVFILGRGFCIEFDTVALVAGLRREFTAARKAGALERQDLTFPTEWMTEGAESP